jgi:alpha-tubulin suppressor-like RCC1 family protein
VYGFANGVSCDDGDPCTSNDRCAAGVCSGTAFLCDTPPAPSCIDAHTLRTASAPTGTCSGGCIYAHTDVTCSGGSCAAGACSSGAGGVVTVAAGSRHTCALLAGGGIKCWGDNTWGQLGDGTNTQRSVPVAVQGLAGPAIALAAGETATCALITGGAVQCWGSGALGALGDGGTTDRSSPVTVQGLGGAATAIAVGSSEGCALIGGGVKCWGDNGEGKLGAGSTDGFSLVPLAVQGLPAGVAALSLGYGHGCAIGNGNVPQCWGFNLDYELGNPGVVDFSAVAVPATAFTASAIGVGANAQFTCIVTSAGAVQCIGDDGEAGFGPVTPAGLESGVLAVSAGSYFRCAILTGGKLECWGDDGFGQIGDGVMQPGGTVSVPTVVQGLASGVVQVSTGQAHTCAITGAGHVKCWGFNAYGQLGNNSTNDTNAPVSVIGF